MGSWWFGRKHSPGPVRPYLPDWLSSCAYADAGEGFARSYEAQYDEVFKRNPVGQRAVAFGRTANCCAAPTATSR